MAASMPSDSYLAISIPLDESGEKMFTMSGTSQAAAVTSASLRSCCKAIQASPRSGQVPSLQRPAPPRL